MKLDWMLNESHVAFMNMYQKGMIARIEKKITTI
jgi:hypothetical protein